MAITAACELANAAVAAALNGDLSVASTLAKEWLDSYPQGDLTTKAALLTILGCHQGTIGMALHAVRTLQTAVETIEAAGLRTDRNRSAYASARYNLAVVRAIRRNYGISFRTLSWILENLKTSYPLAHRAKLLEMYLKLMTGSTDFTRITGQVRLDHACHVLHNLIFADRAHITNAPSHSVQMHLKRAAKIAAEVGPPLSMHVMEIMQRPLGQRSSGFNLAYILRPF